MKYPIRENAMNSLELAIYHFKKFFFSNDLPFEDMRDHIKISLVFLENSIELFLKSILVVDDPYSIYRNPNSPIIKQYIDLEDQGAPLEDFLLQHSEELKTIGYYESIKLYDKKYSLNLKGKNILEKLGTYRNSITHFGIDFSDRYDDLVCCFYETFDVIYNYLYPELINLETVGEYFVEDDFFVKTLHGTKPLLDENFLYNNIIDFLDEMMEIAQDDIRNICRDNPKRRIEVFYAICLNIFNLEEYKEFAVEYQLEIKFDKTDSSFDVEFFDDKGGELGITAYYSSFHNSTIYLDELVISCFVSNIVKANYIITANIKCILIGLKRKTIINGGLILKRIIANV